MNNEEELKKAKELSLIYSEIIGTNKYIFANCNSIGPIRVFFSPFGNCQIYSISKCEYILRKSPDDILLHFKAIQNIINKNLCMVDINTYYSNILEEVFKGHVRFKQPYENTKYHTKMVVYLLETFFLNNV